MRSKMEHINKSMRSVRDHEDLILNWFRANKEYSCGVMEGLNRKAKLITRRSYEFRNYETLQIALFHTFGRLPKSFSPHRFW